MPRGKVHSPVYSAMPKTDPHSGLTCASPPSGKLANEKSGKPTSNLKGSAGTGYGGIDKGKGKGGAANR
jgi:hypothetical protein